MTRRPLRRILVVDDERDIRTVARIALEAVGGFEVSECASGTDAVQRVAELRPDLVLLDVMMPGTDGPATLTRLRASAGAPVVVFLTARVQPSELACYEAMGAAGVITKPFDPMKLPGDVLRIWQRAEAEGRPPAAHAPRGEDPGARVGAIGARFVASLPVSGRALEAAVAAGSAEEARRIAHRLRGTAGTFGLPALAEAAAALEDALQAGQGLGALERDVARLRERLHEAFSGSWT